MKKDKQVQREYPYKFRMQDITINVLLSLFVFFISWIAFSEEVALLIFLVTFALFNQVDILNNLTERR